MEAVNEKSRVLSRGSIRAVNRLTIKHRMLETKEKKQAVMEGKTLHTKCIKRLNTVVIAVGRKGHIATFIEI